VEIVYHVLLYAAARGEGLLADEMGLVLDRHGRRPHGRTVRRARSATVAIFGSRAVRPPGHLRDREPSIA